MLVAAGPHRDQQGHGQGAVTTHYVESFLLAWRGLWNIDRDW